MADMNKSQSDSITTSMPRRNSNKGPKPDLRLSSLPPIDLNLTQEGQLMFVRDLYHSQHDKPSNEQISIAKFASYYEVKKSTLQDRINGVLSKATSNATKSNFTKAESGKLIELIQTTALQGFPLTKRRLEELANHILLANHFGVLVSDNALHTAQTLPSHSSSGAQGAPQVGQNWAD